MSLGTLSSDGRVKVTFRPFAVYGHLSVWREPDDADLFYEDWREVLLEEWVAAGEDLMEMQNHSGHARCPNTRNPPTACQYCLDHFGDANAVWKCLMLVNKTWKKP